MDYYLMSFTVLLFLYNSIYIRLRLTRYVEYVGGNFSAHTVNGNLVKSLFTKLFISYSFVIRFAESQRTYQYPHHKNMTYSTACLRCSAVHRTVGRWHRI